MENNIKIFVQDVSRQEREHTRIIQNKNVQLKTLLLFTIYIAINVAGP